MNASDMVELTIVEPLIKDTDMRTPKYTLFVQINPLDKATPLQRTKYSFPNGGHYRGVPDPI